MAKNKKSDDESLDFMWDGIAESDFNSEDAVSDESIGDLNKENMIIYSANVNYARQFIRVEDSLKPVQRRLLYAMYLCKALPGHPVKSDLIIGTVGTFHNHSGDAAYESLVVMGQYWKEALPLVYGKCNLGLITAPDEFAASRYTELALSKYAMECFFEDFDDRLISTSEILIGIKQPDILPSKFPNILVNGNTGIGWGFAANIPPFNVNDIIEICTKVIKNPDIDVKELVICPDLPTGSDIVENMSEIEEFCTTGKGKLVQRARIDIVDNGSTWLLVIKSIPYGVNFASIKEKILQLGKSGVIPFKAMHDESVPYRINTLDGVTTRRHINFDVEIPKSLDPKFIRHILYKNCDLEKTLALQMRVVAEDGKTTILLANIKELINFWLDSRRLYKRSYYSYRINKIMSTIDIDNALIHMLEGDNLEKTVKIIRESKDAEVVDNLLSAYKGTVKLTSFQAKVISDKNLRSFTRDAAEKYKKEIVELEKTLAELEDIVRSSDKIDNIILKELQDLRKYATPRRSEIITVKGESIISDSDHRIVITTNSRIKKLPAEVDARHAKAPYGAFEQGDMINTTLTVNNLGSLMLFNEFGKYSLIPIADIPNSLYNDFGETVFNITKLDGKIVSMTYIENTDFKAKKKKKIKVDNDTFVYFISKKGFIKMTPYADFIKDNLGKSNGVKNTVAAKVKDDDRIAWVSIIPSKLVETCSIVAYTANGRYVSLPISTVPVMGKNASGISIINPDDDDYVVGMRFIFPEDEYVIVATERGCLKKVETKYLYQSSKRKDSSYIATLENNDKVVCVMGGDDKSTVSVITKSGVKEFNVKDIPTLARKSAPVKMVPLLINEKVSDTIVTH